MFKLDLEKAEEPEIKLSTSARSLKKHWVGDCYPIIFSVPPFSSCPQSFPASESFPVSQLFASGGQRIGASASEWCRNQSKGLISFRDWLVWSPCWPKDSTTKSFLQHHSSKASILWYSAVFIVHLSQPYMTTAKTIALTRRTFVSKVMSLLFNTLTLLPLPFQGASIF